MNITKALQAQVRLVVEVEGVVERLVVGVGVGPGARPEQLTNILGSTLLPREKFCLTEREEWKVRGSKAERVEKGRQKTQQYLARVDNVMAHHGDNMMGDNVKEMVKAFQDQL